jgi:hypothetical protein
MSTFPGYGPLFQVADVIAPSFNRLRRYWPYDGTLNDCEHLIQIQERGGQWHVAIDDVLITDEDFRGKGAFLTVEDLEGACATARAVREAARRAGRTAMVVAYVPKPARDRYWPHGPTIDLGM